MPFKVTYNIMETGKQAPVFSTSDRALAYVELHECHRKQGFLGIGLVPEVTPDRLTKPEEYVWLVYRVRKAMRRYYDCGRTKEDLDASLALERQLDSWNARTRTYLMAHPKAAHGDESAFAFFQVVEEWRNCWHKYMACRKRMPKDDPVLREMKKQCFQMEGEIDKYIKLVIRL